MGDDIPSPIFFWKMNMAEKNIFNFEKTDYEKPLLFMGEEPGLFDTVNKSYPEIWKIYKHQKSIDWDENEFDYSSCNTEFKTCSRSTYDIMIKTLSWQWESDSVASRAILPVLAPFITSSELFAAWAKITEIECLHSATYSEIVRNSFDDPSEVLQEVLKVSQAKDRMKTIMRVFDEAYEASHKYAIGALPNDQSTYNHVFKAVVALYGLERIQFCSSFAVTFAICDTGPFQPIGKAVQKIAVDEMEVHAKLDKVVLENEIKYTDRGKTALEECKSEIQEMLDEIIELEFEWVDYLFSEGREIVGLNAEFLKRWVLFCAKPVYDTFGLKMKHPAPKTNPLGYMEKWLNISSIQAAPQEENHGSYKVGILRRTDENIEYDIDF